MISLRSTDKTMVMRLRVRGVGLDPSAATRRLTSLLSSARLCPVGLPPSAIFFVRTLQDPLPGTLSLQRSDVCLPAAWEQAATAALTRLLGRAVRPALGAVSSDAEAVFFSDWAELLACLARDWCEGRALLHWWWQSLFKGAAVGPALIRAWLDAPEYIPAALVTLAQMGKVVSFAQALRAPDAHILLQSATDRFGLQALQSALDTTVQAGTRARPEPRRPHAPADSPAAPWQPWVPESANDSLSLVHQCLLGMGLMIARAPGIVRQVWFKNAVERWAATAGLNATMESTYPASLSEGAMSTIAMANTKDKPTPQSSPFHEAVVDPSRPPTSPLSRREPNAHPGNKMPNGADRVDLPSESQGTEPSLLYSARSEPERPMRDQAGSCNLSATAITAVKPYSLSGESIPLACNPSATAIAAIKSPADVIHWTGAPIETELGGIFYLINLGIFLSLYGDFTTPAQPGIPLPIWDFIGLLGRQFIGESMEGDPVWPLLARLAGRGGQKALGADFDPPDQWRLPVEWLAPFPERGVWLWAADNHRLRVQHSQQFWVLDLSLVCDDPDAQLRHETRAYASIALFELQRHTLPGEGPVRSPLERWIDWLAAYVRARLCRALGMPQAEELASILFKHHARVFATATHLDIVLSLAELPIAIRLAGLDRNPGWVPAAGRYVAFHFE